MKVIVLLFATVCVTYARYRRETNANDGFNTADLRPEFRDFQLNECTTEVNQCLNAFHTKAKACLDSFKGFPKIVTCLERDDVKQGHKTFLEASHKWHKSMDTCLAGDECEDCPPLIQSDGTYDDDDNGDTDETQFRDKRSRQDSSSQSAEDNEGEKAKKVMKKCWKGVEKAKKDCLKKAARCGPFANCYGEGSTTADSRLAKWNIAIKSQRAETTRICTENFQLITQCLATSPARLARDAYIDDPAGVVVEADEYY